MIISQPYVPTIVVHLRVVWLQCGVNCKRTSVIRLKSTAVKKQYHRCRDFWRVRKRNKTRFVRMNGKYFNYYRSCIILINPISSQCRSNDSAIKEAVFRFIFMLYNFDFFYILSSCIKKRQMFLRSKNWHSFKFDTPLYVRWPQLLLPFSTPFTRLDIMARHNCIYFIVT